ncbi:MAG: acyl-CoA thioesterase [Desulfuromonadales bacterium]|nr:acyl-CoA thioesterase [Desulfuromonadales bacterium]NIR33242.1 acyl-CoA thioesterase [Desulfuromonadales bacterium]NIS40752.1 acyl-CoA thioesterase [Desulfuromonadales bacterium]
MEHEDFCLDFQVRDYECDMQGVVNNAVYQNYLEHTRHEYLKSLGLDFAELTRQGLHLMVIRAELDYRRSLRSGDRFRVGLRMERLSPLRVVIYQRIVLVGDEAPVLEAKIIAAAISEKGRPKMPAPIAAIVKEKG